MSNKPKLPTAATPSEEQTAAADTEAGLAALVREHKAQFEATVKRLTGELEVVKAELGRSKDGYNELRGKYGELLQERADLRQAWDGFRRESSDSILKFGAELRKLRTDVDNLTNLRAVQTDPHAVVKPVKAAIGAVSDRLDLLQNHVDRALERMQAAAPARQQSRREAQG